MKRSLWPLTLATVAVLAVSAHAADPLVISRFSDYIDALRIQTGIPGLAATILTNLATLEHELGHLEKARAGAERAAAVFRAWKCADTPQ